MTGLVHLANFSTAAQETNLKQLAAKWVEFWQPVERVLVILMVASQSISTWENNVNRLQGCLPGCWAAHERLHLRWILDCLTDWQTLVHVASHCVVCCSFFLPQPTLSFSVIHSIWTFPHIKDSKNGNLICHNITSIYHSLKDGQVDM